MPTSPLREAGENDLILMAEVMDQAGYVPHHHRRRGRRSSRHARVRRERFEPNRGMVQMYATWDG